MAIILTKKHFRQIVCNAMQTVCCGLRWFASNPSLSFKVSLAALLLALLFISVEVKCGSYAVLVVLITLTLWSCFSFGKNIGFYVYYAWILVISEVALYIQNGFCIPLWLATVMFLIVGGLLSFLGWRLCRFGVSESVNEDVAFENLFIEREQDLERLTRYLENFKILGVNSFWGNGKTSLYEMFRMRNEKSYFFVSISVMTLQLDNVERFLVSEIVQVLEQNKIYSSASAKLASFLNKDAFHGIGRFFTANSSYTESFQALMSDIKKLDRPLLVTFEDIDRIADRTIVHKVFAISEILTRWTTRVRILFQYDRSKLCKIFEDESYLEKYIPYTIDLTPISFGRCIKVLLKKERSKGLSCHINEKDFYIITSEAHIGSWLEMAGIKDIGSVVNLAPKWYSIRSVELFIKEVETLMVEDASYDKKVVVLFQFVKHFLPDELFNVNLSEGFSDNSIFSFEGSSCNIQRILAVLKRSENGERRRELYAKTFPNGSTNLYYLLLMNKLGYKLSKIIDTPNTSDTRERGSSILNEEPSNIRDRDANEKLDRMVRRMYAMGRSDRTNLENAVKELEDVLNLDGDERDLAFSNFLDRSYHEDFERADNGTIFKIGISLFVPIFQSFLLYENNSTYWLKLIDFYFKHCMITEINADVIQCLNYCRIDDREIFLDIIKRFNGLEIKGNLNATKVYSRFLQRFVARIVDLTGINVISWRYLMSNGMVDDEIVVQFKDIVREVKSELDKLRKNGVFTVVKDDCTLMCSFLDKNNQLIQAKSPLKESEFNVSIHTKILNPVQNIEDHVIKEKLTGSKLDDFLAVNYRNGNLPATEAIRLHKKFVNMGKS